MLCCNADDRQSGLGSLPPPPGGATGTSSTTSGPTTGSTTTDPSGDGETGLIFDVGTPDLRSSDPTLPAIPETCEQASNGGTSVGCVFYAVDMDTSADEFPYAVAVANVQVGATATVSVQTRRGGVWTDAAPPAVVGALSLHEFILPDRHQEGTGIRTAGAYRVTSDVPVAAYQFNPIDGASSFLSDASMLYPVSSLDSVNHVISTRFVSSTGGAGLPYVTIVAAVDGTAVEFTASNATAAGTGVPALAAGETRTLQLQEGDIAQFVAASQTNALTGSRIVSDEEHPVAVLPGHGCINIPDDVCCCDHLQEQLTGVRQWGQTFVAAHMPVRAPATPEPTFWQVYASEDDTEISFDYVPALTGLPGPSIELDAGMVGEFMVTAPAGIEADFGISATKPIGVMGYMVSANVIGSDIGDPAVAQVVPIEQFLPRYVVLVPGTWINDVLVLTRPAGAPITIDGTPVDDAAFALVGAGQFEVARVPIADGVHVLDGGDQGFGVVVAGYDQYDSYAYVGGTGTGIINPTPQG